MTLRIQLTFDAADAHALATWWADVLGYELEDVHDRVAGLLEQGIVTEDQVMRIDGRLYFDGVVTASDPDGVGPRLYVQQVPEPKTAKNRLHLDIPVAAEDLDAEAERLVGTGARLVGFHEHPGGRWAVMEDPEGNEFCLH
jgi:hypothetical protein